MKKLITNIILIITFIIIYFLQVNLFSWFKMAGVMPNLFIIFILFIGLYYNKVAGITYGIILGILLDFFIGKKLNKSNFFYYEEKEKKVVPSLLNIEFSEIDKNKTLENYKAFFQIKDNLGVQSFLAWILSLLKNFFWIIIQI